jgi:hypothetical protein
MIVRSLLAVLFTMLFMLTSSAFAEMYRWTNADGSVGFTDDPGKVPEQYRDQAVQRPVDERDAEHRINYSRPRDTAEAASEKEQRGAERTSERNMTEEEREKTDKEIRAVWEGMKTKLRGY